MFLSPTGEAITVVGLCVAYAVIYALVRLAASRLAYTLVELWLVGILWAALLAFMGFSNPSQSFKFGVAVLAAGVLPAPALVGLLIRKLPRPWGTAMR